MTRTSFEDFNCSFARAVDLVGDKWTLLILRDAFYGISAFSDFRARLGIAPTVLSDRLNHLCEVEILERVAAKPDGDRVTYKLTKRGRELFPVLVALVQWGDRWVFGAGNEPIKLMDREKRSPLQPVAVQARDGRVLDSRDIAFAPGPGATEATKAAFAKKSSADK